MAEVPDINPLKSIWPIRRDDRKQHQEPEDKQDKSQERHDSDQTGNSQDGHIDEYA